MSAYTITGSAAIRVARRDNLTLRKYADPTEGAREITADEAEEIAKEDESLIFVEVTPIGWTAKAEGYHFSDYFDGRGNYLGPDKDGVEPVFAAA